MSPSTKPSQETPSTAPTDKDRGAHVGSFLTWFAVIGGVVAWAIHLLVSWSVMELSCIVRYPGYDLQHGGRPSRAEYAVTYGATVVPWVIALLALLACLRLRALVRRVDDDDLAKGRLQLLVVLGLFLDAMMLAIITGGAIGLYVLEPC